MQASVMPGQGNDLGEGSVSVGNTHRMKQPTFDNMKHGVWSFGTPLILIGFGIQRLAFPKLVTTFASGRSICG